MDCRKSRRDARAAPGEAEKAASGASPKRARRGGRVAIKPLDRSLFYLSGDGGSMRRSFRRFIADRRAATAVEYAFIAIMVSVLIVAGAKSTGTTLSTMYFGKLIGNF
jgi:Flp pilus assembly pilin Flp